MRVNCAKHKRHVAPNSFMNLAETVRCTVSILRIALFESLSLQQKQISGSPKSVSFLGRGGTTKWVSWWLFWNKKVVTNDMQSVTTMAQMWGFAHWKLKLSSARPRATKQSTGLFLFFELPCSNPYLYIKNKKSPAGDFLFLAQMWGFEPQKPR